MTTIAINAPMPSSTTQRNRARREARSISVRPDVSVEAHRPTRVAAARPARINPNSTKTSSRNPPTDARSTPGKTECSRSMSWGDRVSWVDPRAAGPGEHEPEQPEADPPGEREVDVLAGSAPDRPAHAGEGVWQGRGRDGARRAQVAPGEGLDADGREDDDDQRRRVRAGPSRPGRPAADGCSSSRTRSGWRTGREPGSLPGSRSGRSPANMNAPATPTAAPRPRNGAIGEGERARGEGEQFEPDRVGRSACRR